jgi:hypothetical protein
MTHIINCNTKKELKEQIENNKSVYFEDPSLFNPKSLFSNEINEGETIYFTNYKRSFFSNITKRNGKLIVR